MRTADVSALTAFWRLAFGANTIFEIIFGSNLGALSTFKTLGGSSESLDSLAHGFEAYARRF